jgi:cell wall-associated NlpC family hydrolase
MSKEKYDNYFASDVGVFTRPYGFSYETKKKNRVVSDLVLGSALKIVKIGSKHTKYKYPDGRTAWIENRLMNSISSIRGMNYSIQNLIENAHSLIGVPYLWGGTSSKGFDCSGYTKSVYLMNGYILPRDASQQVKEGILVDDSRNWNLLEAGDLMFFGYYKNDKLRIDHVSIWLGDGYFIQSSKNVRISSVYSDNSNFDDYHMAKYIESRRIIGFNTEGIKKL